MPVTLTYPGVYIEEVPSGVRTIVGVATSITAFIGRALRGPDNKPIRIQSFAEYQRIFGGLWAHSTMSFSVSHYFLNGGTDAIIVRVHNGATESVITGLATSGGGALNLVAANPGSWSKDLRVAVDHGTKDALEDNPDEKLFNLKIKEITPNTDPVEVRASETFLNVSVDPTSPRYVKTVLEQESNFVKVQGDVPDDRPNATENDVPPSTEGIDGNEIEDAQVIGNRQNKQGMYALEDADLFNLMCMPPLTSENDINQATWSEALKYCKDRRAMLILDPPARWKDVKNAEDNLDDWIERSPNSILYFPRVKIANSLKENRLEEFAPCGVIAGLFARTDSQRGVWKAPAGTEATLSGVREFSYKMTDGQNGILNPLGVNCLRAFPVIGRVCWGARTTAGADALASEWKYVPVRRVALYIEESLYRGTQWVVFEPNDEPLWAQIRLNVGGFMHELFRKGAFQGRSPKEAYLVKCDSETTTQADIDRGIVNILVGFAPLKPAEFVVIKISQLAGQNQS